MRVWPQEGWTALHYACFDQQPRGVYCMIAAGANVNIADEVRGGGCGEGQWAQQPTQDAADRCHRACVWYMFRTAGRRCTTQRTEGSQRGYRRCWQLAPIL